MTILLFVLGLVTVVMGTSIYAFSTKRYNPAIYYTGTTHNTPLEFVWTLIPCIILLTIAIPSFALIYSLDDLINAKMTIKVMGHQWYWTYEYGEIADYVAPQKTEFEELMENYKNQFGDSFSLDKI
jgi:cytochrome c oxidase subunit 2